MCRKKSLTPEPSRNSSLNRTPIGTLYLPTHTRISRPSSLAASPVVERVLQTESSYGIHTQKQQRARRSLPQQVAQQLEAAGLMTPRMNQNAVWDQAAESIVYDLVRFDSPAAPTHGLIDPNSSFGNISQPVQSLSRSLKKCLWLNRKGRFRQPEYDPTVARAAGGRRKDLVD